ncbi:hypothetical protein ACFCYF_23690 [Streptomyces chartreusis]|uniref:hypothetical protein n=1 Tax=Streptomyces chartreusis TaxID=1969 RepID=UPI0035D9BD08
MDQSTREQLLHAEAAKHGVTASAIDHAVSVIAAVQRRDRADYAAHFGGELTPDRWLSGHGVSGFDELCAYAAQQAGLGDGGGELVRRIVAAIAPEPEAREDDRPVHWWARPLADPAEADFAAYRVTCDPSADTVSGTDWSGARLRRTLTTVTHHGQGAACLEEATGTVVFTDVGLPRGAYIARPAPKRAQPACATCGLWAHEHVLLASYDSCPQFAIASS